MNKKTNSNNYSQIDKSNTIENLILLQHKKTRKLYTCWIFEKQPSEQKLKELSNFNFYMIGKELFWI